MSAPLFRPFILLALLATFALSVTTSSATEAGPARWANRGCHSLDSGRMLCYEDQGLFNDMVSESGRWTLSYHGDTRWTVYAADGAVEYTDRTQVHVTTHGDAGESERSHEAFRYSYASEDYSCRVSSQLRVVDGEVQLDHQVGECAPD